MAHRLTTPYEIAMFIRDRGSGRGKDVEKFAISLANEIELSLQGATIKQHHQGDTDEHQHQPEA